MLDEDREPESGMSNEQQNKGSSAAEGQGRPMTNEEKREHPRYEVSAYVDYTGSELLLYHQIENISLGGICIQTGTVEDVGTIVDLLINFPDLDASVAVQGEVVWANREPPCDMGIRYVELDGDRRETLKRYLQKVRRG
jgi:uncharacterized protein (TIGR02266 family)